MTELNSIEVREGWKDYYLFGFFGFVALISICFTIPSQRKDTIDYFFGHWTFAKLPGFITIFGIMGLCLFYYFDKQVKVRVDVEGIFTKRNKLIPWTDIWYFSSMICKMREGDLYYLKLRLKNTEERLDKEIKIRFRRIDKDFSEIRKVVEYYALQNNIHDMGHEKEI